MSLRMSKKFLRNGNAVDITSTKGVGSWWELSLVKIEQLIVYLQLKKKSSHYATPFL